MKCKLGGEQEQMQCLSLSILLQVAELGARAEQWSNCSALSVLPGFEPKALPRLSPTAHFPGVNPHQ